MPYHADSRSKRVTAGVDVLHGNPACDDGFVGSAVKTATPAADSPRATRQTIVAGEAYNLITDGVIDVPLAGLEAAVKGDLVHIAAATNALSLNNPGAGRQPLGQVSELAGERGGPLDRLRVDLDKKVKA